VSWIRTIPAGEARGELAELYNAASDPETGEMDHIMAIHSLHPAGLSAHLALYRAVMRSTRTLRKVDRELIALVVSQTNGCHY